ncbi:restriction endonuclease subunit S [Massilia timonae]|uniref:restriction endonuclease subunit S n=1 Tax=Massilia timonae TaxID=47229 RepID=UPI00289760CA|nr:restriction endonuclease subunit S [Massilia timonae]
MSVLLSENLQLISAAPNGIQKIRALVLDLAIRGKLVPQDPKDEPASVALQRFAKARARLEANGVCKKLKSTPQLRVDECPFEVPSGWEWVRLEVLLSKIGAGSTPLGGKHAYVEDGIKFLRSQNVWNDGLRLDDVALIPHEVHQKMSGTHVKSGDLLFNITGASIGRCATVPADFDAGNVSQHVTIIRPISQEILPFLHKVLISALVQKTVMDVQVGVSREGLSIGKLSQFLIPLPPVAEQRRIVAKVDELMVLCDSLEVEQSEADSVHAKLVDSLLGTLNQSTDSAALDANWQRFAKYFDTIISTSYAVDRLRKAVLSLAAKGQLVPQVGEAERYPLSAVIEGDSLNGCSKKPENNPSGVQILRISAATGNDDFLVDEVDHKWIDATPAEIEKFRLLPDDLLACRFNGNLHYVGSFSLYQGKSAAAQVFPDKLIRFRARRDKVLPHYLRYVLNADLARTQIESFCATTVGNIGISATNLKTVKVRVPPLDEQHRIIARVDELMALCATLKADLSESRDRQARLASTLLESARKVA